MDIDTPILMMYERASAFYALPPGAAVLDPAAASRLAYSRFSLLMRACSSRLLSRRSAVEALASLASSSTEELAESARAEVEARRSCAGEPTSLDVEPTAEEPMEAVMLDGDLTAGDLPALSSRK